MIRAYVGDLDRLGLSVAISIVQENDYGQPVAIMRLQAGEHGVTRTWEDIHDPTVAFKPTLGLGHVEARALLDALASHFQGAEDTRALRRDYDAERARLDKTTDALAQVALTLAGKPDVWTGSGTQGFELRGTVTP